MIVLDASVVVKVLTEEPGSEAALERIVMDRDRIAPDWVTVEVAGALANKIRFGGLPVEVAEQYLHAVPSFVTELRDCRTLFGPSLKLSQAIGHAFYDCVYLALAIEQGCILVTADKASAAAAGAAGHGHQVEVLA